MIRIVSENSEKDLERKRAVGEAQQAIVELTANLIRITRGAGKPYELGRQAVALVHAMQAHWDTANCWPYSEMAAALQVDQSRDWIGRASELDVERYFAEETMISGALQVTASRLLGQRTQETAGHSELRQGFYALERARAKKAREDAAATKMRKAPAKRKVRKPAKKAPS